MPAKGQGIIVTYVAWDSNSNIGKTNDSGNQTLRLIRDGIESTPANAPSEIDPVVCPGLYKLTLTPSEMNANSIVLGGESTSPFTSIIPVRILTA